MRYLSEFKLTLKNSPNDNHSHTNCFLFGYTFLNIIVISGPDYIRQKYNKPEEVHDVPVELNKEKSPAGSPHFYRKGTTPTQSPTQSPSSSPTTSPSSTRWNFNKKTPVGKEASTSAGESETTEVSLWSASCGQNGLDSMHWVP